MVFLKKYTVHLLSLSSGEHLFEYDIDNKFFENFEYSEVKEASVKALVTIHKSNTVSTLTLALNGFAELPCDRCVESIEVPVNGTLHYTIKETEDGEEIEDENILPLSKSDMGLNLAAIIYENIHLLLPLLRNNCTDSKGVRRCNDETLSKLEQLQIKETDHSDPRWDALKKLKNNNN